MELTHGPGQTKRRGCASSMRNARIRWCSRDRELSDDSEIMNFLMSYVGTFDMYLEGDYAAFVRYCFEDPHDAAILRSRFEPKGERFKGGLVVGTSSDSIGFATEEPHGLSITL
jgi:hypothetical protein